VAGKSTYTHEIAEEILTRMAMGESLRSICDDEHMPNRATVTRWVIRDEEGFGVRYYDAFRAKCIFWADEIVDIADDGRNDWMEKNGVMMPDKEAVARSRLRIDSRRWLLGKLIWNFSDRKTIDVEAAPEESYVINILPATKEDA
jgi:hypothetical protein